MKTKNFFGKKSERFVVYMEDLPFLVIIFYQTIYCHWKLWCSPLKSSLTGHKPLLEGRNNKWEHIQN